MRPILKNVSYTVLSNAASLCISAIITFLLPKKLGIESYSYFQLYLFYVNYIGFLHFGWADGVILRYGGSYYETLDKHKFSGQIVTYCGFEFIVGVMICLIGYFGITSEDKSMVLILTGFAVFLFLPRTLLQYILQGTSRIKEYSVILITEKIIFGSLVTFLLMFGTTNYVYIIFCDLTGKLFAFLLGIYCCKDIIQTRPESFPASVKEALKNVSAGIQLMFANISGMLIVGIARMSIERNWGISAFGKISLTLSISNMLMIFIRAVALVMFPLLRRTDSDKLLSIYKQVRTGLLTPLFGLLILCYPLIQLLSAWLPEYRDGLAFMSILFPMCIFESKMSMMIETYMKTLRKESMLLAVNIITVLMSISVSYVTAFIWADLEMTIISIVALLAFRSTIAEILICRVLNIKIVRDILLEIMMVTIFIILVRFMDGFIGTIVYSFLYFIYILVKKKDIFHILGQLKKLVGS